MPRDYPVITIGSGPTEEDAFNSIVALLMDQSYDGRGYDVQLHNAMHRYMQQTYHAHEYEHARHYFDKISPAFFSAAWDMCRRGILRPGAKTFGDAQSGSAIDGYSMTHFGRTWLRESGGRYDYVPLEPGAFAKLLDKHHPQLGDGYRERAQEACRCYGAHAYLACCAMCGAAAESILLALAIAKSGDAASTEREYLGSAGRGRIEKRVTGNLTDQLKRELSGYISLLKYWRDSSAHGLKSAIQDNEAFTSLALLLRFAQFSTDRWADLISP